MKSKLRENILPILFALIFLLVVVAASSQRKIKMDTGETLWANCRGSEITVGDPVSEWKRDHLETRWPITCQYGLD